jgi:Cu+-exporting ATPase
LKIEATIERKILMAAKDPVCGMMVEEDSAAGTAEHNGQTYYFCSNGCKAAFEQDPQKFLGADDMGEHQDHSNN